MFCLICKKHNKINLQNKSSKFNNEASLRFKRNAVLEHDNSQQKSAVEAKMIRVSVFHKEIERRDQSRDDVIHSAFLLLYWLAKEEVTNKKFAALLEMTELLGLSDMEFFNPRSAGATHGMLLVLGQVIKNVTLVTLPSSVTKFVTLPTMSNWSPLLSMLILTAVRQPHNFYPPRIF